MNNKLFFILFSHFYFAKSISKLINIFINNFLILKFVLKTSVFQISKHLGDREKLQSNPVITNPGYRGRTAIANFSNGPYKTPTSLI